MLDQQLSNTSNNYNAANIFRNGVFNQKSFAAHSHAGTSNGAGISHAPNSNMGILPSNNIFYKPTTGSTTGALPPNSINYNQNPSIVASNYASSQPYNNIFNYSQSNIATQSVPCPSNFTSQFHSPYTSYNTHMPSASHCPNLSNAADITLSTSHIAARQAISKDLPIFSGKPEDWPIFITNYTQSTERCGFTEQENLIRLQKCLKGAALEAVRGKLMMPSTVQFAIETLRMLYGRPEIIHQALQKNLKNEPAVRKERLDTLINFALAVQNYRTTMQAMGLNDYLNDPMLLNELVEKLPSDLKLDWGRYRITLQRVDIVCFDMWLFNLATCASQVTTFSPYMGETKNMKKERILVHDVIDGNKQTTQPASCLKCYSNHRLFQCPEFTALNVNDRWNFIRTNNLCLRCFKKHHIRRCNSKRQCGVDNCKMPHNSLLHKSTVSQQQQPILNKNNQSLLFHAKEKVLFKYIPVTLFGNGYTLNTYALIDEGASCSLIESELAEQLGLDGPAGELCLQWTGEITQKEHQSKKVSLYISDRKQNSKLLLNNVRTITKLDLPVQTLTKSQINEHEHLKDLQIMPYSAAKAKILIGLDNAKLCVPLEVREDSNEGLIATRCRIGWGVHGRHKDGVATQQQVLHICSCNSNENNLDEMLKQYFSLDSVGVKLNQDPLRSNDDERAKLIMESTINYLNDEKCWETGLLWKHDKICLPDSLPMAKRRLACLEAKLQRNQTMKTFLIQKMKDYEKQGYIRKLKPSEIRHDAESWYIPLFTVENKNKRKLRIVWDAAAAVENISLNSVLLKGPDLLKSLVGVLIRFRERPIAICGDIREMFHQIRVRKEDQRFQQFLWRGADASKPIEVYAMTVMTFGAACSPSLANYIKNKNAERFVEKHPTAVQAIVNNTFVDDWLQSVDTEDEMVDLARLVRAIHQDGGFEMRNWLSNSEKVLESFGKTDGNSQKAFEEKECNLEKVLGMWWDPSHDRLTFVEKFNTNVFDESVHPTKRAILRIVMTIFDPLGLLGNFVIYAKILLQEIWRSKVKWDEQIHATEREKWWQWVNVLKNISTVCVPRCYPLASKSDNVQLHVFTDASIDAYAAAAYVRAEYANQISCSLVASKTRVAPLKPISIPKMELMAAILGLRLSEFCCKESSLKFSRRVFWSDSKDVLYWVNSDARKFQQFVAVRVGEILENSDVSEWRWVPSSQNVADDATKWKGVPDLSSSSRWFNGPPFLSCNSDAWPTSNFNHHDGSNEVLFHTTLKTPRLTFSLITAEPTRFSSWEKLRRCQMVILKFLRKMFRGRNVGAEFKPFTENSVVDAAEFLLFKMCQEESYYEEVEQLKNSQPLNKKSIYKS